MDAALMASWRDKLQRVTMPDGRKLIGASFRGVPFFVESHERAGGRRLVNNEFPERDPNYLEDLGRKSRAFPVEGYVLGDDYQAQADALISALEDVPGPGELVHPRYGVRRCGCEDLSVRETTADGGLARFAIKFLEAPVQAIAPTITPDVRGQVDSSATVAAAASKGELTAAYSAAGQPAHALASAEQAIRSAADGFQRLVAPVVKTTEEAAKLRGQIEVITTEAAALAKSPADIVTSFTDAIQGLGQTAALAPLELLNALIATYDVDLGPDAPITTPTRQRERANQLALEAGLRRLFAIEAGRLAPSVTFESIDQANATRRQITDRLDEQAGLAGDAAFPALVQLRADLYRAVPGESVSARLITVTRPVAIPSLLLSYQLYGSVAQEPDLIKRNGIRHPGFVSGSIAALSNV